MTRATPFHIEYGQESPDADAWADQLGPVLAAVEPPPEDPSPPVVQHRGHLRMAQRFITEHADTLRHVHGIGWHEWDGARWAIDTKRIDTEAAYETLRTARAELAHLSGSEANDLFKDVARAENSPEGMLKWASGLPPISTSADQVDAHAGLFNTPGGTVDLHTGMTKGNDRADLITKVAGAPLTTEVDDEWSTFIARILPDDDVRAFVQRLFGYSMLGQVTEHVMPIFTGTGANGKGTLRDALMSAFGDYAIEVDPAILMESKHERHGAFKMRLRGARLVFCSETEKGKRFAEATMKRLVGGDPIEANLMHKNPITFDPSHTLIMLTNHLPVVSGDDPAVWRRILVVPFDVVIPSDQQDGGLPERLRAAAPAVLAWAYCGWLDYQAQGLNPPEVVTVRTREYQLDSDILGRFLSDESAVCLGHGQAPSSGLYRAFMDWARGEGEEVHMSNKAFTEALEKRSFRNKRSSGGKVWEGISIVSTDSQSD